MSILPRKRETFPYAKRRNRNDQAGIWPNHARGRLVDPAAARFYRIIDFYRLLHLGGVSGKRLFLRQLCLAVLFAGTIWRFAPQLVWTEAGVVAGLGNLFAGAFNSLGTRWLPAHLLLLSWRLL
jgi:hypothetical protein